VISTRAPRIAQDARLAVHVLGDPVGTVGGIERDGNSSCEEHAETGFEERGLRPEHHRHRLAGQHASLPKPARDREGASSEALVRDRLLGAVRGGEHYVGAFRVLLDVPG
jgi:hypothetical protein